MSMRAVTVWGLERGDLQAEHGVEDDLSSKIFFRPVSNSGSKASGRGRGFCS
jgi:hypothetical protein